jgi:hypothetical protein
MYKDLKQSVENLIKANSERKRLDKFSRERYDEEYPIQEELHPRDFWQCYYTFKIIDENTIRVIFKYGIGDYDYENSFDVDMRPYYRDEKLNLLDI